MNTFISTTFLISVALSASTSAVDTSLRRRMGDLACLTLDDCRSAALSMGVEPQYFYNNSFDTKGCFTKTNPTGVKKAFWSQGTVEQMSTTELTGIQERLMCEGSPTPTPPTNKPTPVACQTLVEIAAGDERFSTLVAAATAAGLVDTLSNNVGDLTVFGKYACDVHIICSYLIFFCPYHMSNQIMIIYLQPQRMKHLPSYRKQLLMISLSLKTEISSRVSSPTMYLMLNF